MVADEPIATSFTTVSSSVGVELALLMVVVPFAMNAPTIVDEAWLTNPPARVLKPVTLSVLDAPRAFSTVSVLKNLPAPLAWSVLDALNAPVTVSPLSTVDEAVLMKPAMNVLSPVAENVPDVEMLEPTVLPPYTVRNTKKKEISTETTTDA